MKYWLAFVAVIVVILGGLYFWLSGGYSAEVRTINIDNTYVQAEVADTEVLREQGLSGRTNLPEGQGMLFVFDTDGLWGIWMKDMRFPIDVVWVDALGTVVTVAAEVSPDTYPQVFYPTAPARYVLEVPAGYTKKLDIAEGSKIVI